MPELGNDSCSKNGFFQPLLPAMPSFIAFRVLHIAFPTTQFIIRVISEPSPSARKGTDLLIYVELYVKKKKENKPKSFP